MADLEVRETPNRGLGVFARNPIPKGKRILSEPALLTLRPHNCEIWPHIIDKFLALSPSDQARLLQLHATADVARDEAVVGFLAFSKHIAKDDLPRLVRLIGIFEANRFCFHEQETADITDAVFPSVARLNHSCVPNAHAEFGKGIGQMTVQAIQDIAAGEEVRIAYFTTKLPRAERLAAAAGWQFICDCPACDINSFELDAHEQRRHRIASLEVNLRRLDEGWRVGEAPWEMLSVAQELIDVHTEDDALLEFMGDLHWQAAIIYRALHDKTSDVAFLGSSVSEAKAAILVDVVCLGEDHPLIALRREALNSLLRNRDPLRQIHKFGTRKAFSLPIIGS